MSAQEALKRGRNKLAWLLIALGLILLLQGSFTVAKAQIAQVLLQQDWAKTNQEASPTKPWAEPIMIPKIPNKAI